MKIAKLGSRLARLVGLKKAKRPKHQVSTLPSVNEDKPARLSPQKTKNDRHPVADDKVKGRELYTPAIRQSTRAVRQDNPPAPASGSKIAAIGSYLSLRPNRIKIATFGSCLSRFTALNYIRMFKGEVVGSVYHNRVDRFVRTYVSKEVPELPLSVFRDAHYENSSTKSKVIIDNQIMSASLGKHGTVNGPGLMAALEEPLDLIIMDNYIDLIARHCQLKGYESGGIFALPKQLPLLEDRLILEPDHLDIEQAAGYWNKLAEWMRNKQPNAKIFFINFPMEQHSSPVIRQRSKDFENIFRSDALNVIPLIQVPPSLVTTPSHFTPEHYSMLAGYIRYTSRYKRKAPMEEEAADDVLHA